MPLGAASSQAAEGAWQVLQGWLHTAQSGAGHPEHLLATGKKTGLNQDPTAGLLSQGGLRYISEALPLFHMVQPLHLAACSPQRSLHPDPELTSSP